MKILATPEARECLWVRLAETCDIDVEAGVHVDPARVDDVEPIAKFSLGPMWVDIEEVCSRNGAVTVMRRGFGVGVKCVVKLRGQVTKGGLGYLSVDVPIPGKHLPRVIVSVRIRVEVQMCDAAYLAIPPPAK